jgi:hypothetical protein
LTFCPSPTQLSSLHQHRSQEVQLFEKLAFKMARRPARCYRYCKNKVRWNIFHAIRDQF